jgi:serine/threonine-protein kinase
MTSHLTDSVAPPSESAPDAEIPPALDAVVLHALAKSPSDRYPSSIALATALRSALRRPRDVASAAPPPPEDDIGARDTELSLEKPEALERPSTGAQPKSSHMWIVVAIIAALLGIAAGLSISGRV